MTGGAGSYTHPCREPEFDTGVAATQLRAGRAAYGEPDPNREVLGMPGGCLQPLHTSEMVDAGRPDFREACYAGMTGQRGARHA